MRFVIIVLCAGVRRSGTDVDDVASGSGRIVSGGVPGTLSGLIGRDDGEEVDWIRVSEVG